MENKGINPVQLRDKMEKGAVLMLDIRPREEFVEGFIPGSISVGDSGKYDRWVLENRQEAEEVVIVSESGNEAGLKQRFSGLLENTGFYVLEGGFAAWEKSEFPLDMIIEVDAYELSLDIPHDPNLLLIDVRGEEDFEKSHVTNAQHIPLAEIMDLATIANFDENQQLYLYCDGGHNSVLAASIIKRQGVHHLRVVTGGLEAISEEGTIPVTQKQDHSGSQK